MLRWPELDEVARRHARAGDLVDGQGVVGVAGPVDCRLTYGHVDATSCGERVEHPHLRRDHDEALDGLGGEVREPVGDRPRRRPSRCCAVLTQ